MPRLLFTQRIMTFTGLVALLVPVFVVLGFWQWDRFEQRWAATQQQDENAAAAEVPFTELSAVDADVAAADRWHSTTLTGQFDPDHEILIRNRTSDQGLGFYVVTPLVTEDGTAALVNRGWVPRAETADAQPDVPAPPSGEVTVTGRAELSETEDATGIRDRDGLPDGQVMLIDTPALADALPYPVLGGHVEMLRQEPEPEEAPMVVPLEGYNWGLNLAYAVQWWLFAAFAIGALVILVRRELRAARDTHHDQETPDSAPSQHDQNSAGGEGEQGTRESSGGPEAVSAGSPP